MVSCDNPLIDNFSELLLCETYAMTPDDNL